MSEKLESLRAAPWERFETISSTNTYLLELPDDHVLEGYTCSSGVQTHGYGRQQRAWISQSGGLYVSVLLTPSEKSHHLHLLTFVAAVAAADAIESTTPGLKIHLKWPNDIMLGRKKTGGILCQSRWSDTLRMVIGFGINIVNKIPCLHARRSFPVTRLADWSTDTPDALALGEQIRSNLFKGYVKWQEDPAYILESWCRRDMALNQLVDFRINQQKISGTYRGITESGAICIERTSGIETFINGEITHIQGENG